MNYVIAFSGKAQTGKSTSKDELIKLISEEYPSLHPIGISFAGPLKNIAKDIFQWDGDKEIYYHLDKDNTPVADMGRQLLINIGTAFRAIRPSVWADYAVDGIRKLEKNYKDKTNLFIIDDLRFLNEIKVLEREFDDSLVAVRLLRSTGIDIDDESEKDLDSYDGWNAEIINNGNKEQLRSQIKVLLDTFVTDNEPANA